jgi:hypothetical protein
MEQGPVAGTAAQTQPGVFTKQYWEAELLGAPPSNRKVDQAYALLGRRNQNGDLECVGAFSPTLYIMAKYNRLPWQVENNAQYLNHADGTPKTAFELAMIPAATNTDIEKYLKKALTFSNKTRAKLPKLVNKMRIEEEFLPHLNAVGLVFFETDALPTFNDVKVNFRNRKHLTPMIERVLHFIAQKSTTPISFVVGMLIALELMPLGIPAALVGLTLGYLANKCVQEFSNFGVVESLLRDAKWIFDKDYLIGANSFREFLASLDFRKSVETGIYLAAAGFVNYMAVTSIWSSILGASAWGMAASIGIPAFVIAPVALASAAYLSAYAGYKVWDTASETFSYFWTFSCYKNAVDLQEVAPVVQRLPVVQLSADKARRDYTPDNGRESWLEVQRTVTLNAGRESWLEVQRTVTLNADRSREASSAKNDAAETAEPSRRSVRLLAKKLN